MRKLWNRSMQMEELKRLIGPLYVEGDPVGNARLEELKRLTANGKPHSEERNIIERLKAMVGLDDGPESRLAVLRETGSGTIRKK